MFYPVPIRNVKIKDQYNNFCEIQDNVYCSGFTKDEYVDFKILSQYDDFLVDYSSTFYKIENYNEDYSEYLELETGEINE